VWPDGTTYEGGFLNGK
jgi:hypothetical protein